MKKVMLAVVLGVLMWQGYSQYRDSRVQAPDEQMSQFAETSESQSDADAFAVEADQKPFSCDGRTRCEEMTSCAEAEYFLANCPGVTMDGNNDGEPCEMQWCGNDR